MTAVSSTKGFVFNYVARVDAKQITAKEFEKEYVEPRIPCFIDNLIESWPAYSLWTKDYFLTQHRETMIYTNEVGDEHCLKWLSDPKTGWASGTSSKSWIEEGIASIFLGLIPRLIF